MQMTKFGREFSINDRRSALTTVASGALLALIGALVLITGIVQAGNSSGAATTGAILFGLAATAAGGFILRLGVRALRQLRTNHPAAPASKSEASDSY